MLIRLLLILSGIFLSGTTLAVDISGAGATFPQPVYETWADTYYKQTEKQVNYQAMGSGGGINQVIAGTVAFGATDASLSIEEVEKYDLVQFPTIIGAIVPIVNIEGVGPGELTLSGDVLADIYLGEIKKWNNPRIVALNPKIKLPDERIITVYRADGSGTSYNFTYYLAQVSEDWKNGPGASKSPRWPTAGVSGVGGKGNPGVAVYVGKTANTIGYVEYAFAKNELSYTKMINKSGKSVLPGGKSFRAAGDTDWSSAPAFNLTIANASNEDGAWPIAASTFILVPKHPNDAQRTKAALDFFAWAYKNGDEIVEKLGYVPFSKENKMLFKKAWYSVLDEDGNPLMPESS